MVAQTMSFTKLKLNDLPTGDSLVETPIEVCAYGSSRRIFIKPHQETGGAFSFHRVLCSSSPHDSNRTASHTSASQEEIREATISEGHIPIMPSSLENVAIVGVNIFAETKDLGL